MEETDVNPAEVGRSEAKAAEAAGDVAAWMLAMRKVAHYEWWRGNPPDKIEVSEAFRKVFAAHLRKQNEALGPDLAEVAPGSDGVFFRRVPVVAVPELVVA